MPTYAYRCTKCDTEFERVCSIRENERTKPSCPDCASDEVEQVFRPFFAKTSRKS